MRDKNKWYNSWPAIIVWLLGTQYIGQRYIQGLPDTIEIYYAWAAFYSCYVVVATFVIIRKYEQEKKIELQERAKRDREKQKLINQIKELEKTFEKLNSQNLPKDEQ